MGEGWRLQDWANLAQVVLALATIITLGVVAWYTIQTQGIRKAAQRQNEISIMPVVNLRICSGQQQLAQPMQLGDPMVQNIGFGPAFNITVSAFRGGDTEVQFEVIPVLAVGQALPLPFFISQGGASGAFVTQTNLLASLFSTQALPANIDVEVTYHDAAGVRYRAEHVVAHDERAQEITTTYRTMRRVG